MATGAVGLRRIPGRLLRPAANAAGYLTVRLCNGPDNRTHSVHALVAEAFLGPRPDGLIVLHGAGGRCDNRAANLRYGTYGENNGCDRHRDRTALLGSRNPSSKLTEDAVRYIRSNPEGLTQKRLSQMFAVSAFTVQQVLRRKSWPHVA